MGGNEGDGLIQQHYSNHVLEADVGDFAVVHDGCLIRGKLHRHLFYVSGLKRLLLTQDFDRVECGLDWRADRPFFDICADYFVALSKLVDQTGGISVRIVGGKKIVFPREA